MNIWNRSSLENTHRGPAGSIVDGQTPLTVFESSLPESPLEGMTLAWSAASAAPAIPQQTVLLVEDNDDQRQIMEIFLDMLGYRVIACTDAWLALEAFAQHEPINLLLTDVEMPGKSGVDLARDLTALQPSLPVMVVSGSLIHHDLAREMRERHWSFLAKPYALPALDACIQNLLRPDQRQAA